MDEAQIFNLKSEILNPPSVANSLQARSCANAGERYVERRPLTRRALDADPAGMLLNDSVRNSKTQTSPLSNSLSCIERIVNLCDVLRSDPDAGVRNLYKQ